MYEDILVVGAGPTGLVLALTLARAGLRPRVIDARDGIGPESRALDVQARTLELYRQLGVVEALVERGTRISRIGVRDRGRVVASVDVSGVGRHRSPYPFILDCPQDEHEALLVDALSEAGVEVEWRTTLVRARAAGDSVTVTLRVAAGTESEGRVGYLCGSDGASSTVRRELDVAFTGSTSEPTYFVADVSLDTDEPRPSAAYGALSFCLHEDDFILMAPARRRGTRRLVGLVPPGLAGREDLSFGADLQALVERATGIRVARLHWFSTYRVAHRVADRFRVGRAFLLGDAGHLHSPLGGQGMNTGIADAVNLGWKLAAVVDGRADPGLLDTYEPERIGFARSLVATTDRVFRLIGGSGRSHRWSRQVLFRRLLPALLRLPPSRDALCAQIAQIQTGYRGAALSRGGAGRVRGGDRLPWVVLPDGRDNHQPLGSLDWQVHVYGVAGEGLRAACAGAGLAVHSYDWTAAMARVGLRRDALYLVRPDGYLALAEPGQRVQPLLALLAEFALSPRRVGPRAV